MDHIGNLFHRDYTDRDTGPEQISAIDERTRTVDARSYDPARRDLISHLDDEGQDVSQVKNSRYPAIEGSSGNAGTPKLV